MQIPPTPPTGSSASLIRLFPYVLLLTLSAALIFTDLGAGSLHTLDEARHAVVTENILRSGDWLDLSYRGEPYANKPPLKFWLSALTYRALGVNPLSVRLWSALFGLGAVLATLGLGRAMGGRWVGVAAAGMLATSAQLLYVHGARTGELDSALLCWFTLALWGLWRGVESRRAFLLGCLAAGLAGMTKHLAFTVEILAIWAVWMTVTRRWRAMPAATLFGGLAVAAAVVLPWHLGQWARYGSEFWAGYMGREVGTRAFTFEGNAGSTAYLIWIKDGLYPWSWFLPAVAWEALRRRRGSGGPGSLLAVWVAVVAVLIWVAKVKFSWYALPMYPALCIAVALAAARVATEGLGRWTWAVVLSTLWLMASSTSNAGVFNPFTTLAMGGGPAVDVGGRFAGLPGGWMIWTGVGIAAIWGAAGAATARGAGPVSMRTASLALAAAVVASLAYVVPPLRLADSRTDLDLFVEAALPHIGADTRVGLWREGGRDASDLEVFAFRRLGIEVDTTAAAAAADLMIVCPALPYLTPANDAATRPEGPDIVAVGGYRLLTR